MVLARRRPTGLRPWRVSEVASDMDRLMQEAFQGWPFRAVWPRVPASEIGWVPPVEMYEKEDSYVMRAELPGMGKEDVDISISGDVLTIKGERKALEDVKDEEYHRCEVCYGAFSRSVPIPSAVDTGRVDATLRDGVLEVRLPKAKEAIANKIEIKAR